uniref:Uncharacterized protein n=1 Tax=Spongospora subterranea TaxID=70186 RepID=A0A0H5QV89_9EUKA|eukprot:CRZ05511.1 hypothetical protein [Spongospora subterranea]
MKERLLATARYKCMSAWPILNGVESSELRSEFSIDVDKRILCMDMDEAGEYGDDVGDAQRRGIISPGDSPADIELSLLALNCNAERDSVLTKGDGRKTDSDRSKEFDADEFATPTLEMICGFSVGNDPD